jgi:flagellar L-ring protein FlgH
MAMYKSHEINHYGPYGQALGKLKGSQSVEKFSGQSQLSSSSQVFLWLDQRIQFKHSQNGHAELVSASRSQNKFGMTNGLIILMALTLPGCNLARNFSTIGEPPQMTQIKDPRDLPGYEPVQMPMPEPAMVAQRSSNSLWQQGSRAFFKDQRACKVGDVLTIEVNVDRKQNMQMSPNIERQSSVSSTVTEVLGHALPIQKRIARALPGKESGDTMRLDSWADAKSQPSHKATAKYDVQDKMQFNMAAVIIQILPNGNMVVQGREEVRLVNELREIEIKGIVRREDISSNNTVASQKIAQLRISYGGRGDLSDAQSAPWGQQYLNKLLPF